HLVHNSRVAIKHSRCFSHHSLILLHVRDRQVLTSVKTEQTINEGFDVIIQFITSFPQQLVSSPILYFVHRLETSRLHKSFHVADIVIHYLPLSRNNLTTLQHVQGLQRIRNTSE